jgi:plasmid stabilization system protein ParE
VTTGGLGPKRLFLTAAAERDLDGIALRLAEEAGPEVALRYAARLDAQLAKLAALGHSGVSRDWISAGLRMHIVASHCVYFRITDTETRVLRILHGRMDVEAAAFDEPDVAGSPGRS